MSLEAVDIRLSPFDQVEGRAKKVASARRKLNSFRASRASQSSASSSSSISYPSPLVTDSTANLPSSSSSSRTPPSRSPGKLSGVDLPEWKMSMSMSMSPDKKSEAEHRLSKKKSADGETRKLRKSKSKPTMSGNAHRRQLSSISAPNFGTVSHFDGSARGNAISLFQETEAGPSHGFNRPNPFEEEFSTGPPSSTSVSGPETIITTPATPVIGDDLAMFTTPNPQEQERDQDQDQEHEENHELVKTRLSAFSFGSKAPANAIRRSVSPRVRPRVGSPSASLAGSPTASPTKRLSTPSSRGPSLLLTKPTPLSQTPSQNAPRADSPETPPMPSARRRHSHTRSNSISLPNLKLASRPPSLGVPHSPSFPQSPSSPIATTRLAVTPINGNGTRLKFEPSGRGAEAEKEKDEYRRKALEKLTGSSPTLQQQEDDSRPNGMEISLPDLDDEDSSSAASSVIRPFSGIGLNGFTFGRPNSSSSTPGLTWSSGNEDSPTSIERWSGSGSGNEKEDQSGLGFGLPLTTSFSNPSSAIIDVSPHLPNMPTMPTRPSLQRNLSVLAEVEEPEEEEVNGDNGDGNVRESFWSNSTTSSPQGERDDSIVSSPRSLTTHETLPESTEEDLEDTDTDERGADSQEGAAYVPIVAPTPSKLRQLHLLSSAHTNTPSPSSLPSRTKSIGSTSSQMTPGSPTKGYGAIGRGRPQPLKLNTSSPREYPPVPAPSAQSPLTAKSSLIATPKSAQRRRSGSNTRPRASSISYKKDSAIALSSSVSGSTMSSIQTSESTHSTNSGPAQWSLGSSSSRSLFSPTIKAEVPMSPDIPHGSPMRGFTSPRMGMGGPELPRFSGWGGMARTGGARPCPRPKSLAGLGIEGKGANRILGEVDEEEEEDQVDNFDFSGSKDVISPRAEGRGMGMRHSRTESELSFNWRDPRLELEMERDALREDLDLWKERCRGAEERLELEKKEVTILRDRVRKLGDRLSALSSSHPVAQPRETSRDSPLLTEMRKQLFSLTSQLDKERKEKEEAHTQVAQMKLEITALKLQPSRPASAAPSTGLEVPEAFVTPATPTDAMGFNVPGPSSSASQSVDARSMTAMDHAVAHSPQDSQGISPSGADNNLHRMRAWGFPSAAKSSDFAATEARVDQSGAKNKRDSFFGLSNALRRTSLDENDAGVDLPPFTFPSMLTANPSLMGGTSQHLQADEDRSRSVSDPLPRTSPILAEQSPNLPRSSSLQSSASSAISFLSGYIPYTSPPKPSKTTSTAMPSRDYKPVTPSSRTRKDSISLFGSGSRDWLKSLSNVQVPFTPKSAPPIPSTSIGYSATPSHGKSDSRSMVQRARSGSMNTGQTARSGSVGGIKLPKCHSYANGDRDLDFRRSCKCCHGEVMEL